MKRLAGLWTALAGLAGASLAAWLLARAGVGPVAGLLWRAAPGLAVIVALHGVQLVLTALAWRAVMRAPSRPGAAALTLLRAVREGINTLLPLAQLGGVAVAVRLLCRRGVAPSDAVAATVVDMSIEMATQVAFTLAGLLALVALLGRVAVAWPLLAAFLVLLAMAGALLAAQRLGLARVAERLAARFGFGAAVAGLHGAILASHARRAELARGAAWHLRAWTLGAVEVWLALRFLGHPVGWGAALAIESLGQMVKAASFAVPASLGVLEGGYVVLGGLFGVPPDVALAMALMKRLRELALGAPSLVLWLRAERQARVAAPG